jgi:hypothetical protein
MRLIRWSRYRSRVVNSVNYVLRLFRAVVNYAHEPQKVDAEISEQGDGQEYPD